MATYKQIQEYVREQYHFTPKTCWIAHVKELSGLKVPPAPNRQGATRVNPCPPAKRESIRKALKHFGMLS